MNTKYILISIIVVLLGLVVYQTTKLISSKPNLNERNQYQIGIEQNNSPGKGQGPGKNGNGPSESRRNCYSDGCLAIDGLNYPAGDLTEDAKVSLNKALDDEYKAQATYEAVIKKLGNIRPFIMIIRAEEQHISALKALFDKYGLDIPENPYSGKITSPETLADACKTGVDAEIANASLYKDTLIPSVTDFEDITLVFNNLMEASQQRHLAAFQRCAQ